MNTIEWTPAGPPDDPEAKLSANTIIEGNVTLRLTAIAIDDNDAPHPHYAQVLNDICHIGVTTPALRYKNRRYVIVGLS